MNKQSDDGEPGGRRLLVLFAIAMVLISIFSSANNASA